MVLTCGYDREAMGKEKKEEKWIPMAMRPDGGCPTRQEVLEEAAKLKNNGIQLNYDGRTFKIRVPADEEERGWRQLRESTPPPTRRWTVERLPAELPAEVLPGLLQSTIGWRVQVERMVLRGKGQSATKKAIVKAAEAPVTDTIEVGDQMVHIREERRRPEEKGRQEHTRRDFFSGFDEREASKQLLEGEGVTMRAKSYAHAVLGEQGKGSAEALVPMGEDLRSEVPSAPSQASASTSAISALQEAVQRSVEMRLAKELEDEKRKVAEATRGLEEAQEQLATKYQKDSSDLGKVVSDIMANQTQMQEWFQSTSKDILEKIQELEVKKRRTEGPRQA